MFRLSPNSLFFPVDFALRGQAHLGVSPKGPSDQLSFETAHILLGEPHDFTAVEIIQTRSITFEAKQIFTLVGAQSEAFIFSTAKGSRRIDTAVVYEAMPGDILNLGKFIKGARLYLMSTQKSRGNSGRIGLERGDYTRWFSPPSSALRFFEGPEFDLLQSNFFESPWQLSLQSDRMGLRLEGSSLQAKRFDIVSSAVTEGTVQLTPAGPIILMSHHQTTGGYPRILQLCSVDIPTLAQYPVGSFIQTKKIDSDEARVLLQTRQKELLALRSALK